MHVEGIFKRAFSGRISWCIVYLYDFLAFSTRTHVVEDLPFGRWYLQLSSPEFRLTSNVISVMIPVRTAVPKYCEKTNLTADATKAFDDLCWCAITSRAMLLGKEYLSALGLSANWPGRLLKSQLPKSSSSPPVASRRNKFQCLEFSFRQWICQRG